MSKLIYTKENVLKAVSSNPTPLGSIIDRLASAQRIRQTDIDRLKLDESLEWLIEQGLVIRRSPPGEPTLFTKVPRALDQLHELESDQSKSSAE